MYLQDKEYIHLLHIQIQDHMLHIHMNLLVKNLLVDKQYKTLILEVNRFLPDIQYKMMRLFQKMFHNNMVNKQ